MQGVNVKSCADESRGRGLFAERDFLANHTIAKDVPFASCPDLRDLMEDHGILVCDTCRRFLGSVQLQFLLAAGGVDPSFLRQSLSAKALQAATAGRGEGGGGGGGGGGVKLAGASGDEDAKKNAGRIDDNRLRGDEDKDIDVKSKSSGRRRHSIVEVTELLVHTIYSKNKPNEKLQLLMETWPDVPGLETKLSSVYVSNLHPNLLFCSVKCARNLSPKQGQFLLSLYEEEDDEDEDDEKGADTATSWKAMAKLGTILYDIEDPDIQTHTALACALWFWALSAPPSVENQPEKREEGVGKSEEKEDRDQSKRRRVMQPENVALATRMRQLNALKSEIYWRFGPEGQRNERKDVASVVYKEFCKIMKIDCMMETQGKLKTETSQKTNKIENSENRKMMANRKTATGAMLSPNSFEWFGNLLGAVAQNALQIKIPSPAAMFCIKIDQIYQREISDGKNYPVFEVVQDFVEAIISNRERVSESSMEQNDESSDDMLSESDEVVEFSWPRVKFRSSLFHHFEGVAIYPLLSMLNHACAPNCERTYPTSVEAILFSKENIKNGQELTISYIGEGVDFGDSVEERQRDLMEQYGFKCRCSLCSLSHDS